MNSQFKVISMGRVGTLAMGRYIDSHPQISLPPYYDSLKAFLSPSMDIADLFIDPSHKSIKQGIIIHDALFFDKKYRKKLDKMNDIKVNSILHLVRDPFDSVKSWINHINATSFINPMLFHQILPTVKDFHTKYPEHFQTLKAGEQCRTLYKNYKKIKVINFPQLAFSEIVKTMVNVYEFLGVDSSYRDPMLQDKQNSYTKSILRHGIKFELNGEIINMGMMAVDVYSHYQKETTPWVTIHDTDAIFKMCPTLPPIKGDLVLVPNETEAFSRLSLKTRKMLNDGIGNIVNEIIPVWAKNAERIAQQIEASRLYSLTETDRAFVTKQLKDDMDIFKRYHPEVQATWSF